MIDYCTNREEKDKADEVLAKFKDFESKTNMHTMRIGKLIVSCKNKDRLTDYKKIK